MNARVLSNILACFRYNEQKAIARDRRHAFLEWDRLQVDLQFTPNMPKPTLVKLASSHILRLFGMTTWGVGAILLNMQAKLERDENLALIIRAIRNGYTNDTLPSSLIDSNVSMK
jgi:hypothetical protein